MGYEGGTGEVRGICGGLARIWGICLVFSFAGEVLKHWDFVILEKYSQIECSRTVTLGEFAIKFLAVSSAKLCKRD